MSQEDAAQAHGLQTARGTVQLLMGRGLFMVSGYLIAVILARGLGPVEYGIYGMVMSLLLWLEVAGDMGIRRAMIKLIPEASEPDVIVRLASAMLVGVSLVLFALCWILAPFVADFFELGENGAWLFRVAVLDLPFNGLYLAYQGILQGRLLLGTLSMTLVVYSIAKFAGIASLLLIGMSVEAALIVNVLATVAALVYAFVKHPISISFPASAMRKAIIGIAIPIAIFGATMQLLLWIHLWSLKGISHVSNETIGFYVAALNLARLPTIVPFVLTGVVLASVSLALARQDAEQARRNIQAACRFIYVLLLPVCVLGAIDATPIMIFVFSESYADGGPFLALLLTAFCLFSLLDTLLHTMIAAGKYYQVTIGLIALLPVSFVLGELLIPPFGAVGAAMAFVLTMGIGTLAAMFWIYYRFGAPLQLLTFVRATIATVLVAVLSTRFDVSGMWLLLKLSVLMLLYGGALTLMKELSAQDLKPLAVWK